MADALIRTVNALYGRLPRRRQVEEFEGETRTRVIWTVRDAGPLMLVGSWVLLASLILNVSLVLALLEILSRR